jgi:hypothetical protein
MDDLRTPAPDFGATSERVREAELREDARRSPEELLEETLRLSRFASELAEGAVSGAGDVRA